MFLASTIMALLMGAISLDGVTNTRLLARTSFDANNVRLGEPMTLNLHFIGSDADLSALHPPALSKAVDKTLWRIDDLSAKTTTDAFSRRVAYRVRPLKEGVHYFPALTFDYLSPNGETQQVTAASVPVRVKPGTQAALIGIENDADALPMPDGIVVAVNSTRLSDDDAFRWRKACRDATPEAFAGFDFPEARLNEAAAHILAGNWSKAISIYSKLEWRTGQTDAIERGIIAALARKHDSAAVELPAWRQVLRPVLKFAWLGRVLSLALAVLAMMLAFWLCGRAVRLFASVAIAALAFSSFAQQVVDPFDEMDRQMQQMQQMFNQMHQMSGFGSAMNMTFNGQSVEPDPVKTSVRLSKNEISVGEEFEFIVALETSKTQTIGDINMQPSELYGLTITGEAKKLPNGVASNPSNVVVRYSVPVRYDVPFKECVRFRVSGMVEGRKVISSGRGKQSFTFSHSFADETAPVLIEIKPLPSAGQPADFNGIIGSRLMITQKIDRAKVETNDVVTVTCTLDHDGFVPPGAFPDELARSQRTVAWRTYFVADGSDSVPAASVTYYDPKTRKYETVAAKAPRLKYVAAADEDEESGAMAVDAADAAAAASGAAKAIALRFTPSESADVIGRILLSAATIRVTEESGEWARIDDGSIAGWVKKSSLPAPAPQQADEKAK